MGFSTIQINPKPGMVGELTETNDFSLYSLLGTRVRLGNNPKAIWNQSDDGRLIIEYENKFAVLENIA